MSLKIFELVDKNLKFDLKLVGVEHFYNKLSHPSLEYYTYDFSTLENGEGSLLGELTSGYYEYCMNKEKSILLEKKFFEVLNKLYGKSFFDYQSLEILKDSDEDDIYSKYDMALDKIYKNLLNSEVKIKYSSEVLDTIKIVDGEDFGDVGRLNEYLVDTYLGCQ